jgi:hypothetical protein
MRDRRYGDVDSERDDLHHPMYAPPPGRMTLTSRHVMRQARDGNGVATDADAAVDRAAGSGGAPLPADLRTRFESSLGADLSGVRVHTGDASAAANDAVGAHAYALGQDIHFAAGQYDPTSTTGQTLIAHEVAHTVQQRGGAAVRQNKLTVSNTTDRAELEADSAAESMVTGRPATVGGAEHNLYRDESDPPAVGHDDPNATWLEGDPSAGNPLLDRSVEGQERMLKPGQAGYSGAMVTDIAASEGGNAISAGSAGELLPALSPDLSHLGGLISKQAAWVGQCKQADSENYVLAGSGRTAREEARLEILYSQREEITSKFSAYNSWKAFPNQAIVAVKGVEQMMENLGISDDKALLDKVSEGVKRAKEVIAQARDRNTDTDPNNNVAELAEVQNAVPTDQIAEKSTDCDTALQGLNAGYELYRSAQLDLEKKAEEKLGEKDEKRKTEIAEIKAAIQTSAAAIDQSYAVFTTAPAKLASFTAEADAVKKRMGAKAEFTKNAARASSGHPDKMTSGGVQQSTKDVLDFDEEWKSVTNPAADWKAPANEHLDGMAPPEGVGGTIGAAAGVAADLYFEKELRSINVHLNTIASKGAQLSGLGVAFDQAGRFDTFKTAMSEFSGKVAALKEEVAKMKKAYANFGVQLDNMARKMASSLPNGDAPKEGEEMYATIFAIGGQLREVAAYSSRSNASSGQAGSQAASKGAGASLDGFSSSGVRAWRRQLAAARKGDPSCQKPFSLGGGESGTIDSMAGACATWEGTQGTIDRYAATSGEVERMLDGLRK